MTRKPPVDIAALLKQEALSGEVPARVRPMPLLHKANALWGWK